LIKVLGDLGQQLLVLAVVGGEGEPARQQDLGLSRVHPDAVILLGHDVSNLVHRPGDIGDLGRGLGDDLGGRQSVASA